VTRYSQLLEHDQASRATSSCHILDLHDTPWDSGDCRFCTNVGTVFGSPCSDIAEEEQAASTHLFLAGKIAYPS
jgi:hypothetical protein